MSNPPTDSEDFELQLADLLPFVGQCRVDQALDYLFSFKRVMGVLFGIFMAEPIKIAIVELTSPWTETVLVMLAGLIVLVLVAIYRERIEARLPLFDE